VAFDVADARDGDASVEAKSLVVTVGPDRAAGSEAVAHSIFRALDDFADVVTGWSDHDVRMPGADVDRVDCRV